MSLFEPGPTHLDQQQLLDLEERKQLLVHCLEVVQQPQFREQILSEIARALASNQSEIHVSLPVVGQLSKTQAMFSYFDDSSPIDLIVENGQAYTLRLMFMKVDATTIECDLLIVNY
jgi:hypothetical protein